VRHGASDPSQWKWGAGTACADVFEADEAKRKYEDLPRSLRLARSVFRVRVYITRLVKYTSIIELRPRG
jgi:hypothetical protein